MKILLSAIAFLCFSLFHVFEKEVQESVSFLRKEKTIVLEIKKRQLCPCKATKSTKQVKL